MLFEIASMERWPEMLYRTVDIGELDGAPIRDNSMGLSFFYVVVIITLSFFITNLFVGVVVVSFHKMVDEVGGNNMLTEAQQAWVELYRLLLMAKPEGYVIPRPQAKWRWRVWTIVQDPHRAEGTENRFDKFIAAVIAANIFFLSLWFTNASDTYLAVLNVVDVIFVCIFTIEAVLKIIAMEGRYFYFRWNLFDFLIVVFSNFDLFFSVVYPDVDLPGLSILRLNRIFRILRLIQQAEGLRTIIETLLSALPVLMNVGMLVILIFVIWGIAGVTLFGGLKKRNFLNEDANFDNILYAFLTLFRCATGESWNGLMHDTMMRTPGYDCTDEASGDCGTLTSVPFFLSFNFLIVWILLNLFIAVLLEEFQSSMKRRREESREDIVTAADMAKFATLWQQHSPPPTWWNSVMSNMPIEYMPWHTFVKLLGKLEGSLALAKHGNKPTLMTIRRWLNVRLHKRVAEDGQISYNVHFLEVLLALCNRVFSMQGAEEELKALEKQAGCIVRMLVLEKQKQHYYKSTKSGFVHEEHDKIDDTSLLAMLSAVKVQANYRGRRTRRERSVAGLKSAMVKHRRAMSTVPETPPNPENTDNTENSRNPPSPNNTDLMTSQSQAMAIEKNNQQ